MKKCIILIAFIFILFSCSIENNSVQENNTYWKETQDKKVVYTSFYPIYFLANSLIWSQANVINLVPTWWEPHEFEPTLKQIANMQNSDLIILNWLWIESYEEKLMTSVGTWKVIMVSEELQNLIKLTEENYWHEHWNTDPHTWLSPKVYLEMANILAYELEKRWFKVNKSVILELEKLVLNYDTKLKNCKENKMLNSHQAFWYLARDYNFIQHPIMWISPEEEPSTKDIAEAIKLVKENNLKYIFSEEFVSPKFAQTIKKETWSEVLILHQLETLWDNEEKVWENYISIMNKNLEKLQIWLNCK